MNDNYADDSPNDRNGPRNNGRGYRPVARNQCRPVPGFQDFVRHSGSAVHVEDVTTRSVHWNEAESRFLMEDARIVTRGNREFCLKLIDVLLRAGKVRSAHLDFSRHRLAVEFADRSTSRSEAARVLGDSIRLAAIPVDVAMRFDSVPFRQNWDAFAFFADADHRPTVWWWVEHESGHARLDGKSLKTPGVDPRSWSDVIPGLRSSRRYKLSRGVSLRFDTDRADLWNVIASIDEICRSIDAGNERNVPRTSISQSPASRVVHLGLAACSMTCAVVGILIPGVPTVPFVLLTSYHLAKSSNRMHTIFERTPLFGSLGNDWERGRFIRTKNKIWLISISTGVLVMSLSMTQLGGVALVTIVSIYTLTTASVLAMPGRPQRYEMPHITPSRKLAILPG